jgi:RimJ/RimL family protein N-acetyltransferase
MNRIVVSQLASDYCCTFGDVLNGTNIFTVFHASEGQRRFDDDGRCFLKIAATNGKILCCGREDIISVLSKELKNTDGQWFMEAKALAKLNKMISDYGFHIKQAHPFFVATEKTIVTANDFDIVWYTQDEILQFAGDSRFDEAFAFSKTAPDVLGVAAYRDGRIVGMVGASSDSPNMYQIGINTIPEARGNGIGTALVAILKNAVLDKGILPFYGTALSHIASQRVAIKAGFLPAWAELITEQSSN